MKPNTWQLTVAAIALSLTLGNSIGAPLPCGGSNDPTQPPPIPPSGWGSGPVKISGSLSEPNSVARLTGGDMLGANRIGDIFYAWTGKAEPPLDPQSSSSYSIYLYRYDGWCRRTTIHKMVSPEYFAFHTMHQVVTDDYRNALVLSINDHHVLRAFNYVAGTGWSSTVIASNKSPDGLSSQRVRMDGAGNARVMWHGSLPLQHLTRRYQPATGWLGEELVTPISNNLFSDAIDFATSRNGRTVVIRPEVLSIGTPPNKYQSQEWNAATSTWLPAQSLVTPGNVYLSGLHSAVATDDLGNMTFAGMIGDSISTDPDIYTWRNTPGATPNWSSPAHHGKGKLPNLQANNTGQTGMLFERNENGTSKLYYTSRNNEMQWTTPFMISTGSASYAGVTLDDSGNTIIVWTMNNRIWSRRYSCTPASHQFPSVCFWGNTVELSNFASAISTSAPLIRTIPGTGNAVVVWRQDNAMYMRRFYN